MKRGIARLEEVFDTTPRGNRSPPFALGPNTADLLEEFGFAYDSSLFGHDEPYRPRVPTVTGGQLRDFVELPVSWELDDAPYFLFSFFPYMSGLCDALAGARDLEGRVRRLVPGRRLLPARRAPVLHRPPSAHRDARRADRTTSRASPTSGSRTTSTSPTSGGGCRSRPAPGTRPRCRAPCADMASTTARRKFWGWGLEGEGLADAELEELGQDAAGALRARRRRSPRPRRAIEDARPARTRACVPPRALGALCTAGPVRARRPHATARSFRDLVRAFRRDYPPRARPGRLPARRARRRARCSTGAASARRRRDPVRRRLERRRRRRARRRRRLRRAPSASTCAHLDRVLEVDRASRAARIQGGVLGPALEAQLKPHGLTLRHFPQSFELSTLGGWIATRSGGHYATLLHAHRRVRARRCAS